MDKPSVIKRTPTSEITKEEVEKVSVDKSEIIETLKTLDGLKRKLQLLLK
jgi:hypothetical protein